MKYFLTIIILLAAHSMFAQDGFYQLRDKAFNSYYQHKQYDSALFYYQQISRYFPDTRPVYTSKGIADCYLRLGDTAAATSYYLKCLSFEETTKNYFERSQAMACEALADIYYSRGQFRTALNYLADVVTKYKPRIRRCSGMHGGYEGRLLFAYKKSLCYYSLHKKDSAIRELAPLIFRPRWDVFLDRAEFERISLFFAKTIFEVYGEEKAGNDLRMAVEKAVYKKSYTQNAWGTSVCVDYSLFWGGMKISLSSGGCYAAIKNEEMEAVYSKKALLKEFTDSPAYQYIMTGCEDGPLVFDILPCREQALP